MWISAAKTAQKITLLGATVFPGLHSCIKSFFVFASSRIRILHVWNIRNLRFCLFVSLPLAFLFCFFFQSHNLNFQNWHLVKKQQTKLQLLSVCKTLHLLCMDLNVPESIDFPRLSHWLVRCLSLVHHLRPSLSAPACWNTHQWQGCLRWRHVRTLSSTSCASPTPACPAAENCHSSSTSVPLVSLAPSLHSDSDLK